MKLLTSRAACLLIIFFASVTNAFAQTNVSDFGQFTPAEFEIKECSFDKTADAVILLDKAIANYNDDYNLVTDTRIRLKILKEKGIERGDIHIGFYSGDKLEFIRRVNAVIATPDANGNVTWNKLE